MGDISHLQLPPDAQLQQLIVQQKDERDAGLRVACLEMASRWGTAPGRSSVKPGEILEAAAGYYHFVTTGKIPANMRLKS